MLSISGSKNINCECKEFENPLSFATMEKVKTYIGG
jgi:hypothetical protein